MQQDQFIQEMVDKVNQTLGRSAIKRSDVKHVIVEAKRVRKQKGVFGLIGYASAIPKNYFSEQESEKLKNSRHWEPFMNGVLNLMVEEGVLSKMESKMMKSKI
ncbi:hypothetical protein IC620_03390 [Hazenella sp. IB182357]|uniref:Uncharacterized protein n=1 Tax=Polycladospora coralii TaxID=2771432 RepID=A0A926N8P3_9BACL|nr:hypothetical protein [Polycladospora coralii]MBD1371397.1 hypothetical protein [Polycladospora coralii]MBS7530365.1 hypothetical protein [Polycladospora coralii]